MNVTELLRYAVEMGASDLHLKAGNVPFIRVDGVLEPSPYPALSPEDTASFALALMPEHKRREFETTNEADFGYTLPGVGRFRVNAFRQRAMVGLAIRRVRSDVPTVEELLLPPVIRTLADSPRGLVLVTGPTGTGKTTTIAAMIGHINRTRRAHIITIEDPIEVIHEDELSIIQQREVGLDTESYAAALKHVVRQDPDVIFVGEIRDPESALSAIQAAETGHLVISTLHTIDCTETINRILDLFPPQQQREVRTSFAGALRGIVSQRLVPRADGKGRVPAVEVLVATGRVFDRIVDPEATEEIIDVIAEGEYYGMQTFDQCLVKLVREGLVTEEDARRAATNPHDFSLALHGVLSRGDARRPLEGMPPVAEDGGERQVRGHEQRPPPHRLADVVALVGEQPPLEGHGGDDHEPERHRGAVHRREDPQEAAGPRAVEDEEAVHDAGALEGERAREEPEERGGQGPEEAEDERDPSHDLARYRSRGGLAGYPRPGMTSVDGPVLEVPEIAVELGERFRAAGHELALVGGVVRDLLLGRVRPHAELDLATDAPPRETTRILRGWADRLYLVGVRFGTVGARKGDVRFEITTYREEIYRAEDRKPVVTFAKDLETDLSRRDFTINAMAIRLPERVFVDPFGGVRDLAARRLDTPLEPEVAFSDDPLRMLRAARFAAQLDVDPTPRVLAAIRAMRGRLRIVSAERIADELSKLLLAPHPAKGLRIVVETGLAEEFLPELPALALEQDPVHRHKDVLKHTLAVVERCEPDLVLRLAALLHDIGKPATREITPEGVRFHHHEVVGARMARERLRALRYPNEIVEDVTKLVEMHLRFHGYSAWSDAAVRRYVRDAGHLLDRLNQLTRADCTTQNPRKARELAALQDDLEERIARLAEEENLGSMRPPLDGNQVMEHLGIPPGPDVGRALEYLMQVRLDRGPVDEEEARRLLDAWAAEHGIGRPASGRARS